MDTFDFQKEYIIIDISDKFNNVIKLSGTTDIPYFCAMDICEILEFDNPTETIKDFVQKEDKLHLKELVAYFGTKYTTRLGRDYASSIEEDEDIYISENGVYSLILASDSKIALEFERIFYKKILVYIRKFGEVKLSRYFENEKATYIKESKKQMEALVEKNKRMLRRIENTKLLLNNINSKQKKMDWIYIATSDNYSKERAFKVGYTDNLCKKLIFYNNSKSGSDVIYYCWAKKCFNSCNLKQYINHLLSEFKCDLDEEMYRGISFKDLKEILNFLRDTYENSVYKIDEFIKNKLKRYLDENEEHIPKLDPNSIIIEHGNKVIDAIISSELGIKDFKL